MGRWFCGGASQPRELEPTLEPELSWKPQWACGAVQVQVEVEAASRPYSASSFSIFSFSPSRASVSTIIPFLFTSHMQGMEVIP